MCCSDMKLLELDDVTATEAVSTNGGKMLDALTGMKGHDEVSKPCVVCSYLYLP